MQRISILWDASHIWGLMAWRALHALGLTCRITKAHEIANDMPTGTRLLVVPGGNARMKALALGPRGADNIRRLIAEGGTYLGFCGGAGLALTHTADEREAPSIDLCPWSRHPYPDRLQHLISGHVAAELLPHPLCPDALRAKTLALPVWWPGRFLQTPSDRVEILANAKRRGQDFWLGDLPLAEIPPSLFSIWEAEYGLNLSSDFLQNMPLVITGTYGKGRYILSYSHLETPDSPDANLWLASLLATITGKTLSRTPLPAWQASRHASAWPKNPETAPLYEAFAITQDLISLGIAQHLFFVRTPWLFGWKNGLPGAVLNSLRTALSELLSLPPTKAALQLWQERKSTFTTTLNLFAKSAEERLLTSRITDVLGDLLPHKIRRKDRLERQIAIFGCPRRGGGLLGTLVDCVEELLYLSQENR